MPLLLRSLVVLLALALAATAGWRWTGQRREIAAVAGSVEPLIAPERHADLRRRLGREPDPAGARALAARALLTEALSLPPGAPLPTRERKVSQLEAARALAAESLASRPASWDAAMALGAATYLARSIARDDRLFTEPAAWEAPLDRAMELGPGQREPARFAAMAYLEVWGLLPAWKREEVRGLLVSGLAHPETFDRLIGPWLAVADDLETALALMPAEPFAWERLRRIFAGRADWEAYLRATGGWREAVEAAARRRIAGAEELLEQGRAAAARSELLEAARDLPVEGRFAPLLVRAMGRLPAGPVGSEAAAAFERWLDWCLELSLAGGCPLPPEVTGRLARALFDLPPPRAALAALAADDLVRAESYERRADTLFQEGWAPYLVLKARRLAERGDAAGARSALVPVHPSWSHTPAYWRARLAVARAAGEEAAERAAEERLADLSRAGWPGPAWASHGGRAALEVLAARPAPGLELELESVPPDGAVVEVRWDGEVVATAAVRPGAEVLALPLAVDREIHRLEVETLAGGGRVLPGRVRLMAQG